MLPRRGKVQRSATSATTAATRSFGAGFDRFASEDLKITETDFDRRWAWPAAIVGAIAVVAILYGQFVQPHMLPGRYAGHLKQASRDYSAAVSPENPERTVDNTLASLQKTRIAYQRLAALQPRDRSLQWRQGEFALTAADDLARWLHRDRGYLRQAEREQLQSRAAELRSNGSRLLHGLLAQRDEYAAQAADALAQWALMRAGDAAAAPLIDAVEAYAGGVGSDEKTVAIAAAARLAQLGTLSPIDAEAGDDPLVRYFDLLRSSRRELAFAAHMLLLVRAEPAEAYDLVNQRLAAGPTPPRAWFDRVARIQVLCLAGQWDSVEREFAEAISAAETAEELSHLRRRTADACMTALRSDLAVVVPAWGKGCDRAQNLVLQIDSDRRDAAALIGPICRGQSEGIPKVIIDAFAQSQLVPLSSILQSLYLAFHADTATLESAMADQRLLREGEQVIAPLCRVVLQLAASQPADADSLEKLVQSIADSRSNSGTVWYTLAYLQSRHEDETRAAASLGRARSILGPVPVIEALSRRIEEPKEAAVP